MMLKMNAKPLLPALLSLLLVHPLAAQSLPDAPRTVLGSITVHGPVTVGDTLIPPSSGGTIFAGDQVQTAIASAVVQYQQGPRVMLATQSLVEFTATHVRLEMGRMWFRSASADGPVFLASTLRLEPAAANSGAIVTRRDQKASILVTEGRFNIVDTSGARLASLSAGDARLFEEETATLHAVATPPQARPSQAPAGQASSEKWWVLGIGSAMAGAATTVGLIVRASDSEILSNQINFQLVQTQSQNAALQEQASSLQSQLASLSPPPELAARFATVGSQLTQIQSDLDAVQSQISQLLSDIDSQGGDPTQGQMDRLQSIRSEQNLLTVQLQAAANEVNELTQLLQDDGDPVFSPTRNT